MAFDIGVPRVEPFDALNPCSGQAFSPIPATAICYLLSAIGYWLLAIGYWLLAIRAALTAPIPSSTRPWQHYDPCLLGIFPFATGLAFVSTDFWLDRLSF